MSEQLEDLGVIQKAAIYLRMYDHWLLGFVGAGLLASLAFGYTAGTCRIQCVATNAMAVEPTPIAKAGEAARSSDSARRPLSVTPVVEGRARAMAALLALMISLAALSLGAFAGFLFGLPRSLTSDHERARRSTGQAGDRPDEPGRSHAEAELADGDVVVRPAGSTVNTNLEKISDWLTTIIVGVGLTNLPEAPGRLDAYGDNVEAYFGFGGKVFAIAGGLYFLATGFFLFYVLTRVKLSLVFIYSDRENKDATSPRRLYAANVKVANAASPIAAAGAATALIPISPEQANALREADAQVLAKSLSDLKTTDEIIAWGNANARNGDFPAALTAYQDVLKRVPPDPKLQTDYATVLAASGDTAAANNVVASLQAMTGLSPDAEREVRQKIGAATQAATAASLRNRLQQGLYRPAEKGYEDSIQAGTELFSRFEIEDDAMAHIWLACAYGQMHAALKPPPEVTPAPPVQNELDRLANLAADQIELALRIDPSVKALVQSLYERGKQIGNDNDLQSLYSNQRINELLGLKDMPE